MKHKLLKVTATVICMALPSIALAKEASDAEKLRKEVNELMRRIDKLEKGHGQGNACDIKICESCPRMVNSPPEGKMRVTLSGQINKGVAVFDNGNRSSVQEVDVDTSSTRFDILAVGDLGCDWQFGGEYMAEVIDNSTRTALIRGSNSEAQSPLTRIMEVFATYKPWRTQVELGRGYMATYQMQAFPDFLTSSYVATDGSKGVSELATSIVFFDQTANAASSGVTGSPTPTGINVGNVFDPGDGLNRRNRARINIGPWQGFTLSASHAFSVTDNADVALRYAAEWCKWLIAAAVGYCEQHENTIQLTRETASSDGTTTNTPFRQVQGSVGFLSPVGVSFMVAGVQRDWRWPGTKDGKSLYEKIGYEAWLTEVGKTAVAVFAMQNRNMCFLIGQNGPGGVFAAIDPKNFENKGNGYGATIVQKLDRVASELYLVWENLRYKQKGAGAHKFKRVTVGLFGWRLKF